MNPLNVLICIGIILFVLVCSGLVAWGVMWLRGLNEEERESTADEGLFGDIPSRPAMLDEEAFMQGFAAGGGRLGLSPASVLPPPDNVVVLKNFSRTPGTKICTSTDVPGPKA